MMSATRLAHCLISDCIGCVDSILRWRRTLSYHKDQDASLLQAKLLRHSTLKIYPDFPHGMMTTNADVINADILSFIKGAAVKAA